MYYTDPDEMLHDAAIWSAIMFSVAVAQVIGDTLRGWGFGAPGEKLTVKIRTMFFRALMRQDIGWHDLPENNSNRLCANLATEVNLIQALSGEAMGRNILSLFTAATALVFAFGFGSWEMSLVALAAMPVMTIGMMGELAMMAGSVGDKNAGCGREAGRIIGEATSSVRTVASFTLEQHFSDAFDKSITAYLGAALCPALFKSIFVGVSQIALFGTFAFLYWFGGGLVSDGKTDFNGMLTPIFCMFMLGAGLGQAQNGASDAAKASQAADRVFMVVDRDLRIDSFSKAGTRSNIQGEIKFEHVVFRYPSRPDQVIMNDYNLHVKPGTTVALVGSSGSGKSTAIQLLERFYDPEAGRVLLDGVNLKEINVKWLRTKISLVGQEPVLFAGTVAENIRFGKPGATDGEVEKAAKMSNAFDFISTFPEKFDTDVGEKGGKLSGGQKQRIAIARAMIKNPSVLLLDEATSALDNESERIVQNALDELLTKHKRTTIVIAHRLSTIRNADKIAVVDLGRVIEQGTHDELLALQGKYHTLVYAQQH